MNHFEWSLPTRIVYGPGQLERLGELTKPFGGKAFLVTYRRRKEREWISGKAIASLQKEGIDVVIYDQIEPKRYSGVPFEGEIERRRRQGEGCRSYP